VAAECFGPVFEADQAGAVGEVGVTHRTCSPGWLTGRLR
jgi:hypothetical protein